MHPIGSSAPKVAFLLLGMTILFSSCIYGTKAIGYIPTDPVSIPAMGLSVGTLLITVADITDSMPLSGDGQQTYMVHDVRHTAEGALDQAFCATASRVETTGDAMAFDHTLRLISLRPGYVPLGYYDNTTYSETTVPLRGKQLTSSTTQYRPYSVAMEYKAVLYKGDSIAAVFEGVADAPGTKDMPANLKLAMERVAEHLNSDMVQYLLARPK